MIIFYRGGLVLYFDDIIKSQEMNGQTNAEAAIAQVREINLVLGEGLKLEKYIQPWTR